jgi:hypothetical protein
MIREHQAKNNIIGGAVRTTSSWSAEEGTICEVENPQRVQVARTVRILILPQYLVIVLVNARRHLQKVTNGDIVDLQTE